MTLRIQAPKLIRRAAIWVGTHLPLKLVPVFKSEYADTPRTNLLSPELTKKVARVKKQRAWGKELAHL